MATLEGGWRLIPNIRGHQRGILETAPCYAGPWGKTMAVKYSISRFLDLFATELELILFACHARFYEAAKFRLNFI